MRSKYGQVCDKHPELAGRRYVPNNSCIKCHSEQNKDQHARRRKAVLELIDAAQEIRFREPRIDAALKEMRK